MNIIQVNIWDKIVGLMYWDNIRNRAIFEYDKKFVAGNLDIAPLSMSIKSQRSQNGLPWIGEEGKLYQGLPPAFADSLPDKWGSSLFNQWVQQQGKNQIITPVDQLAYLGKRGMGALEFSPSQAIGQEKSTEIDIQELYTFAKKVLAEREDISLPSHNMLWRDLIKIGTSAGGKHPKAVIAYNSQSHEIRSGQTTIPKGFKHYILKFDEEAKFPYTQIEYIYSRLAKKAGITMMPCSLLKSQGKFHFMTERFDRINNQKIHMQTMAAMNPLGTSYEDIFRTMRLLNLPAPQLTELYRRLVFNVIGGNIDDHNKNFTFTMTPEGSWQLSPAYDLTFTIDLSGLSYMNRHEMSINGKYSTITYEDLEKVAKENDIKNYRNIIGQVQDAVFGFSEETKKFNLDIDKDTLKLITGRIDQNKITIPQQIPPKKSLKL